MGIALIVLHCLVAVILIGVVLLQSGKAGSISDVFGGGGSMAAFGARSAATILTRITTIAAIIFMLTSLGLSMVRSTRTSVMEGEKAPAKQEAPKAPAPAPAPQK